MTDTREHQSSERPVIWCDHCGLECGPTILESQEGEIRRRFCCAGCRAVYAILKSGKTATRPPIPVYDGPIEERVYRLSGLWCSACAWLIEHTLNKQRGVAKAEVHFVSDLLKIAYYPKYLPAGRVQEIVKHLGYQAFEEQEETAAAEAEHKDLLVRLVVAAFLWMNVMGLNLAVYFEAFEASLPILAALVTLPVILYSAQPVLRIAWRGLRHGALRMESLLSLGIVSAFGYSLWQGLRGGTHLYFDIACAITTLVLLGKWIEQGAKQRAAHSIGLLHRMLPKKARQLERGAERFVSVEALRPGDVFVVKAGERIPADGVVLDGASQADESLLTGESAPVSKQAGSPVVGGSLNLSGILKVQTTNTGAGSTIAQIVAAVERAIGARSEMERKVDRVSRWFVPFVIGVALLVFAFSEQDPLLRAITVLVIACPCALGIATPLALTAAVTAAARLGILVRDCRVLESVRRVDTVVLDKTGTVTEAEFSLLSFEGDHFLEVASLEAYSEHPLGQAVLRRARELSITLKEASEVEIVRGQGIRGRVDGKRIEVGAPGWLAAEAISGGEHGENTVAYYAVDGVIRGKLTFGNRVRESAQQLATGLRARGMEIWLLSGDTQQATAAVARKIGAHRFQGATRPEQKIELIEQLKRQGRTVAMVGDGINDAPALAAAHLGIALGSGTDLAMRSASMVLTSSHLTRVLDAFDLSTKTYAIVRQNLFWAFFYNTLGIGLAAQGWLNPILAAAAMVVSSLTVIGNSYRLSRFRPALADGKNPLAQAVPPATSFCVLPSSNAAIPGDAR
ncbi:MAG: heavy metal translocating P-type ATPase [Bryobacteraceae bacterium]|nr:heavy metal translocating P-type ATPase [Bryobacteraceae bacterium]MDW8377988.1 heavy metal translocating P-type ATPase [Bryobacterales bacterium]